MTPRTTTIRSARGRQAQGRPAGVLSRSLANVIDLGVAWVLTFVLLSAWSTIRYVLFGDPLRFPRPQVSFTVGLFWLVLVLYLADGWGSSGKTIGKRIVGLRVEGDGRRITALRWILRAALTVSFAPVMLGWVLLARDNRGLHDRIFHTRVVYDWSRD